MILVQSELRAPTHIHSFIQSIREKEVDYECMEVATGLYEDDIKKLQNDLGAK